MVTIKRLWTAVQIARQIKSYSRRKAVPHTTTAINRIPIINHVLTDSDGRTKLTTARVITSRARVNK